MTRRFRRLIAAVAVVAFAAPTFANAAPEVTVGGKRAAPGTHFTATSGNTLIKTSIGNLTCATVEISGIFTLNTGSTVAGVANGAIKTATCFFKGTTPITIDDATLLSLHSGSVLNISASLTLEATLPGGLTCHYSGSVPGTYYEWNKVSLTGFITAKPAACGTAIFEGVYALTSPGGAVVLH